MTGKSGVHPLRLDMKVGGHPFVVHAAVIWDDEEAILVDTGIRGQLKLIREAFDREGLPFGKLTRIVITHQDRDHIGSLPELVEAFEGRVHVLAHEVGVPFLQGEVPLLKSGVLAASCKVDTALKDGDVLPWAGGIEVIHTPGHSPDHISLYHRQSKTLISGDALTSEDGVLMGPNPQPNITPDLETALASVGKLRTLDIERIITYHGGSCTDRIMERLKEIAGQAV